MSTPLFDTAPKFDSGVELTQADQVRLTGQIQRVYFVLADRQWHTVPDIQREIRSIYGIHDPETSISAQLRNLRKARFGGYTVERRRVENTYQFRVQS